MKITVLTENTTADPTLIPEHGVSFYIETASHKILFDMGQSDLFAKHAEKLGIDLSLLDIAVLSHGHYDHGGGLSAFLRLNDHAPIYVSEHAFAPHFRGDGTDIGLQSALMGEPRIKAVGEHLVLDEGLELFSCNERERPFGTDTAGLCMSGMQPEDFRHEQYLLIREGGKRVLISGCSHKGILNIAEWFAPDILVGGLHLNKHETEGAGSAALARIAAQLQQYNTRYYTCHCTGLPQFRYLKERMGEQILYLSTGMTISL